jgi:acetyl-CoA carboxylase carboxyl transferase subunit beta
MLDRVIARSDLRDELATMLRMLTRQAPYVHGDLPAPGSAQELVVAVEEAAPAGQ